MTGQCLPTSQSLNLVLKFRSQMSRCYYNVHMLVTCFISGFFFLHFRISSWLLCSRLELLCQRPAPLHLAGAFVLHLLQVGGNFDWPSQSLSIHVPLCPPGAFAPSLLPFSIKPHFSPTSNTSTPPLFLPMLVQEF